MTVWKTTPVDQVPVIELRSWAVFKLPDGDRHFVGYNMTEGEGRASSKILEWDPLTRQGKTRSGRVYQLVGESEWNAEAGYVWTRWCRINGVVDALDVSAEYE